MAYSFSRFPSFPGDYGMRSRLVPPDIAYPATSNPFLSENFCMPPAACIAFADFTTLWTYTDPFTLQDRNIQGHYYDKSLGAIAEIVPDAGENPLLEAGYYGAWSQTLNVLSQGLVYDEQTAVLGANFTSYLSEIMLTTGFSAVLLIRNTGQDFGVGLNKTLNGNEAQNVVGFNYFNNVSSITMASYNSMGSVDQHQSVGGTIPGDIWFGVTIVPGLLQAVATGFSPVSIVSSVSAAWNVMLMSVVDYSANIPSVAVRQMTIYAPLDIADLAYIVNAQPTYTFCNS